MDLKSEEKLKIPSSFKEGLAKLPLFLLNVFLDELIRPYFTKYVIEELLEFFNSDAYETLVSEISDYVALPTGPEMIRELKKQSTSETQTLLNYLNPKNCKTIKDLL